MRSIPPYIEQKLLSKVQAGPTALSTDLWISRPTIPLTENRFLERQSIIPSGVTRASITVSHPYSSQSARKICVGYVEDGVAKVKSAEYRTSMSSHVWKQEPFETAAVDVSVCYDGLLKSQEDGTAQFLSKDPPWVFWVSEGVLRAAKIGLLGDVVLATANCTRVSAVRAVSSEQADLDFGLVVFFILAGSIYYRQLIQGEWKDAELVQFGPSGVTWQEISAYRTWDYRVGFQALASNGKVYQFLTQYQGFGKHGAEHMEIQRIQSAGNLLPIVYTDLKHKDEHVEVATVALNPVLYGGWYRAGVPQIASAYNIADSNMDWGKTLVLVFDRHLVAEDIAAQPRQFSIVDSLGRIFTARTATLGADGLTITLTFINFNSAVSPCYAQYEAGTVHSMAGVTLEDVGISWTPSNLVPSVIPIPQVAEIINV